MKLTEEQNERLKKSVNGKVCPFCHSPLIAPADKSFQLVSHSEDGKVEAVANVGLMTCSCCGFVSLINLNTSLISDWDGLKKVHLP